MGLEYATSISEVIEEMKRPGTVPQGMTKEMFIETRIMQSLVESDDIDLLIMGALKDRGVIATPMIFCGKILKIWKKIMTILLLTVKLVWNISAAVRSKMLMSCLL